MRKEIDRILGNSLRCILPSYWWKRLLGKMADRIEFAEESAASASRIAMLAGLEASNKQPQLVSGSNIKTINNQSILGSGNITVNTERMEKYKTKEELDAVGSTDGGEIAAVVDDVLIEKSFTECYQPTRSEIEANPYNKKFTKVDGLALNPDFSPNLISSNYGTLSVRLFSDGNSKGYHKEYPSHMEIRCGFDREIFCWEYDSASGLGHRLYDSSGFHASNIDRVNNILREGNFRFSYFEVTYKADINDSGYRYYYSYNDNFPSDATAMIDKFVKMLFAETQNADVYVRSKEWVRLLKEGDVVGGGPEILELTFGETEEDRAKNVNIYNKIVEAFNSDDINIPNISAVGAPVSSVTLSTSEGETTVNLNIIADYISFKFMASLSLTKTGEVTFEEELEYSDYYFITNSSGMVQFYKCVAAGLLPNVLYTDPHQGVVIADTFNGEGDNIVLYFNLSKGRTKVVVSSETGEILSEEVVSSGADITIDSELSDTSENPVQNKVVTSAIESIALELGEMVGDINTSKADNTRVDLISERLDDIVSEMGDFATESQLNNKQDVITDLDTIRQGAAKGATALQSVPSEYVTEAELNQKGYATTTQLSNKQDVISDLSTIRANADKGATALQSVPSEYVTETELSSKNFATVSQVNAKQDTISDLATIRSNAAKGATAIQQVKTINGETIDGEGNIDVLTKDLYDNILEEMLVNEEVYAAGVNDLNSRLLETNDALNSEVASREELSEEVQALTDRVTSNEEVTATSYNELNSRIESNYQHGEEAYATKTELADEVSTINAAIVDNEEVIAATLNDLLSRIESLTTRIEQLENA